MKKFSTASLLSMLIPALCLIIWPALPAFATVTTDTTTTTAPCAWAPGAPDHHRVRRGDTLWDLASIFLQNPWCWTKVWEPNQALIRDPHWIYPGQLITLDRAQGVLRLNNDHESGFQFAHLSPGIRSEAADEKRIPLISRELQQRLHRAALLSSDALAGAPVIAGLTEQRSMAGKGDVVIVRGEPGTSAEFDVVRPALAITDPDTGDVLGIASLTIARVRPLGKGASAHRFVVSASSRELKTGDKLMPVANVSPPPVSPHPSTARAGKLAAILHEGRWAALHDLVAINRGSRDGLDPGSVVSVVRQVRIPTNENQQSPHAPEDGQAIALLLVVDVTERLSLAVVMHSTDAITIGDSVLPPEPPPQ